MSLTRSAEDHRPRAWPIHVNYHEVAARNNSELGEQLGCLFGPGTRECLEEARSQKDWKRKLDQSCELLDATRSHFPHLASELEAYAAAAGLEFNELWTLSVEADLDRRRQEHCTTFVSAEGEVAGHNEDFDEEAADYVFIVKKSLPGVTILELMYVDSPLGGNAFSVNSHGYVQCINSLSHADFGTGVPRNVIARWLSETRNIYCDFIAMSGLKRAAGYNHVVVDRRGSVYDIECSAGRQVMSMPRGPFVHTNHYLTRELGWLDSADEDSSTFTRHARARKLMKGRMTAADLIEIADDRKGGPGRAIFNRNTVARAVFDRGEATIKLWLRREADAGWIDYPAPMA